MKTLAMATLLVATTALASPALAVAQPKATALTVPVTGSGSGALFSGTFQLQKFATDQGQLVATGLLSGVVTNAAGVATSVLQTVTVPAAVTNARCQVLHLDLGPLSLNLLGLQINLNEIVLDITAVPGAGNLLGNLLCAVTNLLDNPSSLAKLLNSVLAAL